MIFTTLRFLTKILKNIYVRKIAQILCNIAVFSFFMAQYVGRSPNCRDGANAHRSAIETLERQ